MSASHYSRTFVCFKIQNRFKESLEFKCGMEILPFTMQLENVSPPQLVKIKTIIIIIIIITSTFL